jgi:hypothetical protein
VTVHVHIERVVVDGLALSPADRRAFGDTLGAELTRLLIADGLPGTLHASVALHRATAPALAVGTRSAGDLGRHVAGAVYRSLGP